MAESRSKSRLGKGLSALLGQQNTLQTGPPVQVFAGGVDVERRGASGDSASRGSHTNEGDNNVLGDGAADLGGGLRSAPLSELTPNRFQPRQTVEPGTLEGLAASLRSTGLMQPIVVRPYKGSAARAVVGGGVGGGAGGGVGGAVGGVRWEIIAGERRWRAAALAGLKVVPVIVRDIDDRSAAEWALIENIQREDLNPMDRAAAFRGLSDRFGLTQAQIAERVGIDRSTVANLIRLTELEAELQSLVRSSRLSAGHAKVLLSLPEGLERLAMGVLAAEEEWSVRTLEERAEAARGVRSAPLTQRTQPAQVGIPPERQELERQIGEHLGTRVRLATNAAGRKGRIIIDFYSVEHFDGLMNLFGFQMRS